MSVNPAGCKMELIKEEKVYLLKLARHSIEKKFYPSLPGNETEDFPILSTNCGAFVTLSQYGELRGCIGYIFGTGNLYKTITSAAQQAAFHDPRFSPLQGNELEMTDIEISLLSEPFPMNSYDEIVVGKHGLIVDENGRRGLLLPQVPVEHNMNKDEYLTALCRKAGLPGSLWKERLLNIEMFTAEVFSEKEELNDQY